MLLFFPISFTKIRFLHVFFFIFSFFLSKESVLAQMPFSVKKDPHFYTAYNPLQNIEIHPDFNSSIHPRFQSTLNPQFRSQINPMLNAQINPQFNAELNPQFQSRLNPDFNPSLRILTPDFVYYSLELEPLLFFVASEDPRVFIGFNYELEFTFFLVSNGETGFNLFDAGSEFTGIYFIPNGQGGFNVFSMQNDWLGFTAP